MPQTAKHGGRKPDLCIVVGRRRRRFPLLLGRGGRRQRRLRRRRARCQRVPQRRRRRAAALATCRRRRRLCLVLHRARRGRRRHGALFGLFPLHALTGRGRRWLRRWRQQGGRGQLLLQRHEALDVHDQHARQAPEVVAGGVRHGRAGRARVAVLVHHLVLSGIAHMGIHSVGLCFNRMKLRHTTGTLAAHTLCSRPNQHTATPIAYTVQHAPWPPLTHL